MRIITDPTLGRDQVQVIADQAAATGESLAVLPALMPVEAHVPLGVLVSYPLGSSQVLVKAAEARLAVEQGADEILYCPSRLGLLTNDSTILLTEAVAMREAVPEDVRIGVCIPPAPDFQLTAEIADLYSRAGTDLIVIDSENVSAGEFINAMKTVRAQMLIAASVEGADREITWN